MRADKFDQYATELVRDVDDQAVLIAAEIKDHAVVGDEVYGRAKPTLDIARPLPPFLRHCRKPRAYRTFSLRMPFPELLECPARDHLHAQIDSMSPKRLQEKMSPQW
jgi:hypothetical protein